MAPRTLVIGLDAAEPLLLRRWCDSGDLPVLRGLLAGTAAGPVETGSRQFPDPAMLAAYTGLGPARLGRYFFIQPRRDRPRLQLTDHALAGEPFWVVAGRHGRRCIVVDTPKIGLAPPPGGVHVVGWGAHGFNSGLRSEPPALARQQVAMRAAVGVVDDADVGQRRRAGRRVDQLAEPRGEEFAQRRVRLRGDDAPRVASHEVDPHRRIHLVVGHLIGARRDVEGHDAHEAHQQRLAHRPRQPAFHHVLQRQRHRFAQPLEQRLPRRARRGRRPGRPVARLVHAPEPQQRAHQVAAVVLRSHALVGEDDHPGVATGDRQQLADRPVDRSVGVAQAVAELAVGVMARVGGSIRPATAPSSVPTATTAPAAMRRMGCCASPARRPRSPAPTSPTSARPCSICSTCRFRPGSTAAAG